MFPKLQELLTVAFVLDQFLKLCLQSQYLIYFNRWMICPSSSPCNVTSRVVVVHVDVMWGEGDNVIMPVDLAALGRFRC